MSSTYALSAWFFTRAISLIYLAAFVSLAVQAKGLWGAQGVLPMGEFLSVAGRGSPGMAKYFVMPSIFWLESSNLFLVTVAWVGAVAALAALLGFAQGWMLLVCFAFYLSFVSAGQDFMGFQWDALLCEVGFLTLFAVPWSLQHGLTHAVEPHWLVRVLFYFVLFKLMFLSGMVKILSGDPTWRDLSAMSYHYWTQPLPNPLSPFMHALPKWFHQFETVMTFLIELVLPFLMLTRITRPFAALGFIGLSVLILLTGNYTFFNWLTIALALWLIPDSWWNGIAERMPIPIETWPALHYISMGTAFIMAVLALVSVLWTTRWFLPDRALEVVNPVLQVSQYSRINNPYGLFAVMTTSRPEIAIEGSRDGVTWKRYEFKYKAGSEYRMPPVVAPHQPRLDWQMWFAALNPNAHSQMLNNLANRLREGAPDVLELLADDPFAGGPPAKQIRLRMEQYEFASPSEILDEGRWWKKRER